MSTPKTILCPVDFSACSDHALDYGLALAAKLDASVCLFHAWELPAYAVPDGALAFGVEVMGQLEHAAEQKLEQHVVRTRARGVRVQSRVMQGPPAIEIVRQGGALGVDLIVMGTHGRTGVAHLMLGSVAERVVRTAGIPVLTVPLPTGQR